MFSGKTYRVRVHHVGISTSLNFRIQNHNLLLAETEGYYTAQQNYSSLDIHVGQSFSFLVTMDQNASTDYYIVASARFVNGTVWDKVTGVGVLHYSNSKGPVSGPLPDPPNDIYDKSVSMNQAMSIRFVLITYFVFEIMILETQKFICLFHLLSRHIGVCCTFYLFIHFKGSRMRSQCLMP